MRILHTADWQIGMKAVHLRDKAEAVRRARFQAARKVVEIARAAGVDFILLAGDTFEHHGISRPKVREVANLLNAAPCPVFVLPGNHDPAVAGSVWDDECWKAAPNVSLLLRAEPVPIPGGTLFPCPALAKNSLSDPTAWIPAEPGGGFRIGAAHGSVEGPFEIDACFPIPADAAERAGLDYLALGHYHSTVTGVAGSPRMAYSGTHEPTSFGERDSGNVLVVEIDSPGAAPRCRTVASKVLEWRTFEREIRSEQDLKALAAELDGVGEPEQTLVRCTIAGEAAVDGETLEQLTETTGSRFLFGDFNRDNFVTQAGGDSWVDDLPAGYIRNLGTRLRQEAETEPGAAAALAELRREWREARQ